MLQHLNKQLRCPVSQQWAVMVSGASSLTSVCYHARFYYSDGSCQLPLVMQEEHAAELQAQVSAKERFITTLRRTITNTGVDSHRPVAGYTPFLQLGGQAPLATTTPLVQPHRNTICPSHCHHCLAAWRSKKFNGSASNSLTHISLTDHISHRSDPPCHTSTWQQFDPESR